MVAVGMAKIHIDFFQQSFGIALIGEDKPVSDIPNCVMMVQL
jgi:hypothetical protein